MFITNLELLNFRNYKNEKIDFNKNINIFYGDNAQGKTNILESIYISSIGKSYRTKKEKEIIKFNEENSNIKINYEKKDRKGNINIYLSENKEIKVNGIKIKKLSELLGKINIVIFNPDDINLLKNGPINRRKFLDIFISQLRPNYIYYLNNYNNYLIQRNNYLKQINNYNKENELLKIWDEKLAELGEKIFLYRKEFIEKINNKINLIHKEITENTENIEIKYNSDFLNKNNYLEILKNNIKKDIYRGYTTKGIHRDDFMIYINNKEVNLYGSQGQNRTAILSLKKSELEIINDEIGEYPVLLLDDFMSELDNKRINNFLKNINNIQVIITCTEKININNCNYNLFNVKEGIIKKEK